MYEDTNPDWVPTLKMGWDAAVPDVARYQHSEQRKRRRVELFNDTEDEAEEVNALNAQTGSLLMLPVKQIIVIGF